MKKIGFFSHGKGFKIPYSSKYFLFVPDECGHIDLYEVEEREVFPHRMLSIPAFELKVGSQVKPFEPKIWKHKNAKALLISPYYWEGKGTTELLEFVREQYRLGKL